jgi:NADH dehydrogenase
MQAAQSLAQSGAEILLIDRNPYHTFVPLLYQVAAAQLEPEQIIYPMHTLVRRRSRKRRNRSPRGNAARTSNLQFLRAEVKRIDFSSQTVETENLDIPYDYLVLATGSRSQFFDVPGASDYALPLRTLEEAIVLRDRILSCCRCIN